MKSYSIAAAAFSLSLIMPAVAHAQWTPGAEIVGQAVQVQTNGVVNTVHFDPGGGARIVSPGGSVVQGTWSVTNNQLCLMVGGATECWPYTQAFQAGQAMQMTSSCQTMSTWLPQGVNPPPQMGGERG